MALGSSGISDNYGGGGLSPEEVQAVVDAAIAESNDAGDAAGRNGWVTSPQVVLSGVAAVNLMGIPLDANEVIVTMQGVSPTVQAVLGLRVFNDAGVLMDGTGHFGSNSDMTTSGTTGRTANNITGVYLTAVNPLATHFLSGQIRLTRQETAGTGWFVDVNLFESSIGLRLGRYTTPSLGVGMTGVQIYLASGAFDGGSVSIKWRK